MKNAIHKILRPLVDTLLALWEGVHIHNRLVRGVLLSINCDLPAVRKTAGMKGPTANKGCSRCHQIFPTQKKTKRRCYCDGKNDEAKRRDMETHRQHVERYQKCKNDNQRKKCSFETGVTCSELLRLPYIDLISFITFDPLHNILLGTAKRPF